MSKLLSGPLAVAVSAAFVMTLSLSSCNTNPVKETASSQLTPEEAAREAAEKQKAAEKKRARELRNAQPPSGSCGH